ncbi:hypothetical protein [Stygiolobus azoricus]|nr:hypothetical protein [Stygiolobus azoricus]
MSTQFIGCYKSGIAPNAIPIIVLIISNMIPFMVGAESIAVIM